MINFVAKLYVYFKQEPKCTLIFTRTALVPAVPEYVEVLEEFASRDDESIGGVLTKKGEFCVEYSISWQHSKEESDEILASIESEGWTLFKRL